MRILVDVSLNLSALILLNVAKINCGIFVEVRVVKSNVLEALLDPFQNLIVHVQLNANKDVNVCLDIFVITVVRVSLLVTVIAVD
jgi:hypothetical protein